MDKIAQGLVIVAAVVVIVVGCLYADEHVTCFNVLGFTKGCLAK